MIGRIFAVVCKTNGMVVYVGSTFDNIDDTFRNNIYNFSVDIGYILLTYTEIHELTDNDLFTIHLIKEYEVVDNLHLSAYEQLYINKYKAVNNKDIYNLDDRVISDGEMTYKEYNDLLIEKFKETKKEEKKVYNQLYYKVNKERLLKVKKAYNKTYYQKNKDKILVGRKEYQNNYYRKNKEIIKSKRNKYHYKCSPCNYIAKSSSLIKQHLKTKRHNHAVISYITNAQYYTEDIVCKL